MDKRKLKWTIGLLSVLIVGLIGLSKMGVFGDRETSKEVELAKRIKKGDRIAQLVIQKVERAQFVEVENLPGSERSADGFGSTGK